MEQRTLSDAQKLLESASWSDRKDGMRILAALGERQLMVEYALVETVPAVLDIAAGALYPEPLELVLHMLRPVRGRDPRLHMRYQVALNNYLYAGTEIAALFARSRDGLHPDVIEAAGLAYLRPMAQYLPAYARAKLLTYARALRDHGRQAVAGVEILVSSDGSDEWSRASLCAVEAVVALRRMEEEVDRAEVSRMLGELDTAMDSSKYCSRRTRAMLRWVEYDAGRESDPGPLLRLGGDRPPACLPDLLTTLLKRGEYGDCERIARDTPDVYCWAPGFCFWPLVNFLEARGLLDVADKHGMEAYARARQSIIDPPPWWTWQ
jgi:hypothetical protein